MSPSAAPARLRLLLLLRPPLKAQRPAAVPAALPPGVPPQPRGEGGQPRHTRGRLGDVSPQRPPSPPPKVSPQQGEWGNSPPVAPHCSGGQRGNPNMAPLPPQQGHQPLAPLGDPHARAPGPIAMAVGAKWGTSRKAREVSEPPQPPREGQGSSARAPQEPGAPLG